MRWGRWRDATGVRSRLAAAKEAYDWDRLEQAHEMALDAGAFMGDAGLYRLIEAEYEADRLGVVRSPAPWLDILSEPLEDAARLDAWLLEVCEETGRRLGYEPIDRVRIAILPEHTDAPWRIGRAGYCVDKYPYDKICLPFRLLDDPEELREAVGHEYAHVAAINLGRGRVPRWLDEAIAMTCGGRLDPRAVRFLGQPQNWLRPGALNAAFGSADPVEVHLAYQQAALIGRNLEARKGSRALGDLLRAIGDDSWQARLAVMLGADAESRALHAVYGASVSETFAAVQAELAS